ncbi:DUF6876 family protein [Chitinophaga sp. S165]|uniref:DUF6876 family protein n=1 Tax=Chitinophaga sp. S165 TaxID=2135462 RepID=UPI000D8B8DD2|nr:DUF6876 family protein [Chitinophaga sp. S165]PWV55566.1 hypothetical protein C7475_10172 [Chitinophaga sp. S165]
MEQTNFRNVNRELSGFTGTSQYYKHFLGNLFTDGIYHLREKFQCFWLVDDIMAYVKTAVTDEFQVWRLKRKLKMEHDIVIERTDRFDLICEDGNYNVLFSTVIPFSDFEGDEVMLYFCDGVLLLPSEY